MTLGELRSWQSSDPRFAGRMGDALAQGDDLLEDEVFRRAVVGVTTLTTAKDGSTTESTRYSDTLLVKLLGARNPAKWRETVRTLTATAPGATQDATLDLSALTLEEQRNLRDYLARAEQRAVERTAAERQSQSSRSGITLQ